MNRKGGCFTYTKRFRVIITSITTETVKETVLLAVNGDHSPRIVPSIKVDVVDVHRTVSTLAPVLSFLILVEFERLLAFSATFHSVSEFEVHKKNHTH